MFNRTIPYKDLDGNDIADEFYFNINRVEALEFVAKYKGAPGAVLKKAFEGMQAGGDGDDNEEIILKFFRDLLAASVGKPSDSGKSFIKSDALCSEFMNSDAYSSLFFDLVRDADLAAEFVNKVFPKDIADLIHAQDVKKEYSDKELLEMSDEEFTRVAGSRRENMTQKHLMIAFQRLERTRKVA